MDGTYVTLATLPNSQRLQCCRVCLATCVKLFDLYTCRDLDKDYAELTGIPVSPADGLPQYLCSMCAALLVKSAAFRTKCRDTHALLRLRKQYPITMSFICNLDRIRLQPPYNLTDIITIDLPGNTTDETERQAEPTVETTDAEPKANKILNFVLEDVLGKPNEQIKYSRIRETNDTIVDEQEIKNVKEPLDEEDKENSFDHITDEESIEHSNNTTEDSSDSEDVLDKPLDNSNEQIKDSQIRETSDTIVDEQEMKNEKEPLDEEDNENSVDHITDEESIEHNNNTTENSSDSQDVLDKPLNNSNEQIKDSRIRETNDTIVNEQDMKNEKEPLDKEDNENSFAHITDEESIEHSNNTTENSSDSVSDKSSDIIFDKAKIGNSNNHDAIDSPNDNAVDETGPNDSIINDVFVNSNDSIWEKSNDASLEDAVRENSNDHTTNEELKQKSNNIATENSNDSIWDKSSDISLEENEIENSNDNTTDEESMKHLNNEINENSNDSDKSSGINSDEEEIENSSDRVTNNQSIEISNDGIDTAIESQNNFTVDETGPTTNSSLIDDIVANSKNTKKDETVENSNDSIIIDVLENSNDINGEPIESVLVDETGSNHSDKLSNSDSIYDTLAIIPNKRVINNVRIISNVRMTAILDDAEFWMLDNVKPKKTYNSNSNKNVKLKKPKSNVKRTDAVKKFKMESKRQEVKSYLKICSDRSLDHPTKRFFDHILDKFFYKTKQSHYNDKEFESDYSEEENDVTYVRTDDDLVFNVSNNTDSETAEIKKRFYGYIRGKYVKKDPEYINRPKKIRDLTQIQQPSSKKMSWPKCQNDEGLAEYAKEYNFEYIVLSKEEQIKDVESRKDTPNYRNALYKCEKCFKGYNYVATFENHIRIHDPEHGSYACELCHARYRTSHKLMKHKLLHKRKFICKQCHKRCEWSNVKDHYRVHEGHDFMCEQCGKLYKNHKSLTEHTRTYHASSQCGICYQTFAGAVGVGRHRSHAHSKTFRCATCDVPFENKEALIRHIKTSPDDVCEPHIRPCAKCGENFAIYELDRLEEHIKCHVQEKRQRAFKRSKTSAGPECGETFSQSNLMRVQVREEHPKFLAPRPSEALRPGAAPPSGSGEQQVSHDDDSAEGFAPRRSKRRRI